MPKADSPQTSPQPEVAATKLMPNNTSTLKAVIEAAKHRFVERNQTSGKLFEQAVQYLPGGNTRTLLYSAPFPLCMKKGVGYEVIDEDDHT
jgi:glutamate-1-semialdehyde 2,1-aminomutase